MSTTTATVETLTAEVRVLMVGSRQVTLSVYRQLDHVHPLCIEPFGRVNAGKQDPYAVWVVGRSLATGELVKSARWLDRWKIRVGKDDAGAWAALGPSNDGGSWTCSLDVTHLSERELQEMLLADAQEWGRLPLIVLAGLR